MKRIAAVSMFRNEADVIESFVRHCLSFADFIWHIIPGVPLMDPFTVRWGSDGCFVLHAEE